MNLLVRLRLVRFPILLIYILLWFTAFACTHAPGGRLPDVSISDVTLHSVGFWGLTTWLMLTLAAFGVKRSPRIAWALAIMLTYAVIDEYTQQFFHRSMDFKDLLNDAIGTYIAVAVFELVFLIFGRRRHGEYGEVTR